MLFIYFIGDKRIFLISVEFMEQCRISTIAIDFPNDSGWVFLLYVLR